MKTRCGSIVLLFFLLVGSAANAQFDEVVDNVVESQRDKFCTDLDPHPLPVNSCVSILTAASEILKGESGDNLRETLRTELTKPEFLNSALAKAFGDSIPLGLEFKSLDGESGDTVLALGYSIDHEFKRINVDSTGKWNRHYSVIFEASGNITEDAAENPRNFLESRFTGFGIFSTRLPQMTQEFGLELERLALVDSQCNDTSDTAICEQAENLGFEMLDHAANFIQAFQFYKVGFDAGLESDQEFDAIQTVISAFVYGQYESWGSNGLLDTLNITPSIRIGIDSIDPNSDSPRALAGDESSFTRLSGEVSLWIPLETSTPMALTFNFRHYRELGASSIVKTANLDSYNLRTYSLTGPNGLYASYSSGRLPLDLQDQNVVEFGWRTYFE